MTDHDAEENAATRIPPAPDAGTNRQPLASSAAEPVPRQHGGVSPLPGRDEVANIPSFRDLVVVGRMAGRVAALATDLQLLAMLVQDVARLHGVAPLAEREGELPEAPHLHGSATLAGRESELAEAPHLHGGATLAGRESELAEAPHPNGGAPRVGRGSESVEASNAAPDPFARAEAAIGALRAALSPGPTISTPASNAPRTDRSPGGPPRGTDRGQAGDGEKRRGTVSESNTGASAPTETWPGVVWCLVGPTATGKTAFATELAHTALATPIEIISADSRMVYRGMDIGTAKPDALTLRGVPHHLVDVVDPDEPFSVVDWVALARSAIHRIVARGHQPLIVGGTGLYFRALCDGLDIPPVPANQPLRAALEAQRAADGWQAVHALLAEIDPVSAGRIDGRNVRRVIRAIEVTRATGRPFSDWQRRTRPGFASRWVGFDLPTADLDIEIARRARAQFDAGLVAEVARLRSRGFPPNLAPLQGLAYREAAEVLDGKFSTEEAIRQIGRAHV